MSTAAKIFESYEPKNILSVNSRSGGSRFVAEAGDIFSATVSSVTGKKFGLTTKTGAEFNADAKSLTNCKIGDELFFQVVGSGENELKLKQVFPGSSASNSGPARLKSSKNLSELMLRSEFTSAKGNALADKRDVEREEETGRNEALAVSRIRRELIYASRNTSSAALRELIKAGVSFENIDLRMLNSVSREVANRLDTDGLAANDNKAVTAETAQKINDIKQIDEGQMLSLIDSEKELTLGNIYKAVHSPACYFNALDDNTLRELSGDIAKTMKNIGAEETPENKENAELLVKNGIELNKENLEKLGLLKKIPLMSEEDFKDLLNASGENFSDTKLTETSPKNPASSEPETSYKELYKALPKANGRYIDFLLSKNIPLTLSGIVDAVNSGVPENIAPKQESLPYKKQLYSLQVRLNADNLGRLAKRNINIMNVSLEKALSYTEQADSELYTSLLAETGCSSQESVSTMKDLFFGINSLKFKQYDNNLPGSKQSLENIFSSVQSYRISEAYLSQATRVSAKYGDSPAKVETGFESLLLSLGYSANPENIRAAKILSKTGTDINEENMSSVKLVNMKIDKITSSLHPKIAADMLRDGINPLKLNIDEVINIIERYNGQFGDNLKDKTAQKLLEAEKNKDLTQYERKAVTAVYRMLYHIQKHGLASVGVVLKTDKAITFGNLLDASKLFEKSRMNRGSVDITVGSGEYAADARTSYLSDETISRVFKLNERVIDDFTGLIDTASLKKLASEPDNRVKLLEDINSVLRSLNSEADEHEISELLQKTEKLKDVAPGVIGFIGRRNLALSYNNIEAVRNFTGEALYFTKLLTKLKSSLEENSDDSELGDLFSDGSAKSIETELNGAGHMPELLRNAVDMRIGENSGISLSEFSELKTAYRFLSELREKNSSYALPVKFNGKSAEINMYFTRQKNDFSEPINVAMSLDSGKLGTISAYASVKEDRANINIACKNSRVKKALADNSEGLKRFLAENGFTHVETNFFIDGSEFTLFSEVR